MHSTSLKKVGGSVMLTIPPTFLDSLHLKAGEPVNMRLRDNKLIIEPEKFRYKLSDLIAQCDSSQPLSSEEKILLADSPLGIEEI